MENNPKIRKLMEYFLLIVGGIITGISVGFIFIPMKISTGGFSGIASLLYYIFKIPASIGLALLNIPIFIISWKVLGKKYGIRSIIGMICASIGITIGEKMGTLTNDFILASIYGGVIAGIGMALTYRAGGSTGGTDLIAKLIRFQKPHMNLGEILLFIDGVVITSLAFTFSSIEILLYSIVSLFVMTKIIDLILEGADYAKAIFIITEKGDDISNYIMNVLNRTSTKIKVIGTYSNLEKDMIICVMNKKEVPKIKDAIFQIDDKAFTVVTTVTEALGNGFKENKKGL